MAFFLRSAASSSYVFALDANWLAKSPPLLATAAGLNPPLLLLLALEVDVGLNPPENSELELVVPFAAGTDGLKPVLAVEALGASAATEFELNKLLDGAAGWLLIALANMLDVAVGVGGLNFGVGVEGCAGGAEMGSAGRARFEGEALRSSCCSSLTLRFVDKLDSCPVTPLDIARCFFALSIRFFNVELCWKCHSERDDQSAAAEELLSFSR